MALVVSTSAHQKPSSTSTSPSPRHAHPSGSRSKLLQQPEDAPFIGYTPRDYSIHSSYSINIRCTLNSPRPSSVCHRYAARPLAVTRLLTSGYVSPPSSNSLATPMSMTRSTNSGLTRLKRSATVPSLRADDGEELLAPDQTDTTSVRSGQFMKLNRSPHY